MIDHFCSCLKDLRYDLFGYAVGQSRDNKIGILGDFAVRKIFADNVNNASEFGIDIRIGLACKSLTCKVSESEAGVICKTSYEFCADIPG